MFTIIVFDLVLRFTMLKILSLIVLTLSFS